MWSWWYKNVRAVSWHRCRAAAVLPVLAKVQPAASRLPSCCAARSHSSAGPMDSAARNTHRNVTHLLLSAHTHTVHTWGDKQQPHHTHIDLKDNTQFFCVILSFYLSTHTIQSQIYINIVQIVIKLATHVHDFNGFISYLSDVPACDWLNIHVNRKNFCEQYQLNFVFCAN